MAEKTESEISTDKFYAVTSIAIGVCVVIVLTISAAYQFDMPASTITSDYLIGQVILLIVTGVFTCLTCLTLLWMSQLGPYRQTILLSPLAIMFIIFTISLGQCAMVYPQYYYHYVPLFFLGHKSYHGMLATSSILSPMIVPIGIFAVFAAAICLLNRRTMNVPISTGASKQSTQE